MQMPHSRAFIIVWAVLAIITTSLAAQAILSGGVGTPVFTRSISSVTPTSGAFTAGAGSANTIISTEVATLSAGTFSGQWSLSGADLQSFIIDPLSGVLKVGPGDLAPATYHVNVVATQSGISGSPFIQAMTIAGNAPAAQVSFNPTSLTFASQTVTTTSAGQVDTITNISGAPLPIFAISDSGANPGDFGEAQTCTSPMPINGTCQVNVTFTPTATGARSATLTFQSTNGGPISTIPITGTGAAVPPGFYVATNGNDGTLDGTTPGIAGGHGPFATVQRCQTAMQSSANKTCYIRAGTYTGGGLGYSTQTLNPSFGAVHFAIVMTNADNNETLTEYAPDFPANGISNAIFDGGASAWQSTNSASCPYPNPLASTAAERGVFINGGSGITIDRLQFRNFCWSGVAIHGDTNEWNGSCMPAAAVGTANNNTISNNYILNTSSAECAGDGIRRTAPIEQIGGTVTGNTFSHNAVLNTTSMGIRSGIATSSGNESNTTFTHNYVYNANTDDADVGAYYAQDDCAGNVSCGSTGFVMSFNYATSFGQQGCGGIVGGCSVGYYLDNGQSNTLVNGNICVGLGDVCIKSNNSPGSGNTDSGNIVDMGNVATVPPGSSTAYVGRTWTQNTAMTDQHNIIIAKTTSCGPNNICALQGEAGTSNMTISANDYQNYGGNANSILTSSASAQGDASPSVVAPNFSCNSGGGVDAWSFFIPAGSSVFNAPVSYPAQPAGWGTPGFWGPAGFALPHNGIAPSYIGSGINGC